MMANGAFGIDHPLVTVRDIAAVAERYRQLGFDPTPLGRHPWGTVNRLVMFPDNFVELIAVADRDAIEADPVGGHRFGRRIRSFVDGGEGISLMALHSKDAEADEAAALARGAASDGRVDFRRAVTLPDQTRDEAVVTLAILPDRPGSNLGFFLCQQHKPHLVWNPQWCVHRNGATAITRVTYLAGDLDMVRQRFEQVWGKPAVEQTPAGVLARTAAGEVWGVTATQYVERFAGAPLPDGSMERMPCGVAISIRTGDLDLARRFASAAGIAAPPGGDRLLVPPEFAGNVLLELHA